LARTIETVLIFLAIVSLWPWILGYRTELWSRLLLIAALVAMVWVAVRRVSRIRRTR
jgi:hypothetical protein